MTFNQPPRPSRGRFILGMLLALLVGVLTPVVTVLEATMLLPVVLLGDVFMVFLYCYAGRVPSWFYMIATLCTAGVLLGSTFVFMLAVSGVIPAMIAIRMIALKRPFFDQIRVDIASSLGGMLAAVVIAHSHFGGNMIVRLADALRAQYDLMPDSFFAPFVDMVNRALSGNGLAGFSQITVADYRAQIAGLLNLMTEVYQESLPGSLLCGAALSGVLAAYWGNWLCARRGLATEDSYAGLKQWFLPRQFTMSMIAMLFGSYLLSLTDYSRGEILYYTLYSLAVLAFFIQALAAVDRYFYRRGASSGRRRAMVIVTLLLGLIIPIFHSVLFGIGACSALFGSHGAIRRIPNRGDSGDDDQDDQ